MHRVVNNHVDKVEEIEDDINAVITEEIAKIDIDEAVAAPLATLALVADNIKRIFLDRHAKEAVELGVDFGKDVKKKIEDDKTIKVDKSKDPNLNKEEDERTDKGQ